MSSVVLSAVTAIAGQVVSVETTGVTAGAIFSVTATGLDATAANNRVTFTPAAGAPVTVAAASSAIVDAARGIRRISLRVPGGLDTGTATVSILNTVTSDTTNVGTINILTLSLPDVRSGAPGATGIDVLLRAGGAANFVAGQTRVTFGAGVTVRSVTVISATELRASIDIAAAAVEGPRPISVTVPRQSLVLMNGFTVASSAPVNQDPVARFTFAPASPRTGEPVAFDATTSSDADGDPLTYEWAFGDGASATTVTASHTYATAATVSVSLTVRDGRGGVGTATQSLVIAAPPPTNHDPVAAFTFQPASPTTNQAVSFDASTSSDQDGDPLTYEWAFGDGASATTVTASHTYATAATVSVSLTVRDGRGGVGTVTQSLVIATPPPTNHDPVAAFTFQPASPTTNQAVSFDASTSSDQDGDPLTYEWAFGDGAAATTVTSSHAFATATTFTVSLTVRDGRGGANTTTRTVTVTPETTANRPPTAAFTASSLGVFTNQDVTVDAAGTTDPDGDVLTYAWTFGDGASASGTQVTHAYAAAGSFTVTLTVNDGRGGTDTASKTVVVTAPTQENRQPTAVITSFASGLVNEAFAFDGGNSSDPDGDALTYAWQFGDGATATGVAATHTYTATGPFTVTLTVQ